MSTDASGDECSDDVVPTASVGGQLVIVATPIGNLEDLSPRAVKSLAAADVILAEDTRRTRALLTHLGITGKRIERLDAHVERQAVDRWVTRLLGGENIALVTDAGTPAISDPGAMLVRTAATHGRTVVAIPGPSAVITALAGAGFRRIGFASLGFCRARAVDEPRHCEPLQRLRRRWSSLNLPTAQRTRWPSLPSRAQRVKPSSQGS